MRKKLLDLRDIKVFLEVGARALREGIGNEG